MELAAADEHLSTTAFGQMLLRRCVWIVLVLPHVSHHNTLPHTAAHG